MKVLYFPGFFEVQFVEKEGSLPTYNLTAEEVWGFEVFLSKAGQDFKHWLKIQV